MKTTLEKLAIFFSILAAIGLFTVSYRFDALLFGLSLLAVGASLISFSIAAVREVVAAFDGVDVTDPTNLDRA